MPDGFNSLYYLQTINLEDSGLNNGNVTNSVGEFLPEFLRFDR